MRIGLTGAVAVAGALLVAACQSGPRTPATFVNQSDPASAAGQEFGAPAAVPGAAPGIGGGAVLGGISTSDLGRSLSELDRQRAAQAEFYALEAGQAGAEQRWSNPETGVGGTIVAGEPYQINQSQCRDYTHTVTGAGGPSTLRSTACRQPNGTWRSVGT